MQMQHHFAVPIAADEAWKVLLDVERIAPCMPGASLDSVEGDTFGGRVKVKVGPVGLTYKGTAEIVSRDESTHTAVIKARGRDSRGNGTATATVTMVLSAAADGAETGVDVLTELDVTGRPAQLGRGVMADVGGRIIGQFAAALAEQLHEERSASVHRLPVERNAELDGDDLPAGAPPTPGSAGSAVLAGSPHSSTRPASDLSARAAPAARTTAARRTSPDTVQVLGLAGGSVLRVLGTSLRGVFVGSARLVRRLLTRTAR
ncbi:SRPBCC family protein [Streptomyces sp. 184]|uniref:SRPBCC family protein n=1 Tax=Streptomyces sp. 184 TaxID=1827526 RepID=UPI003891EC58